MIFELRILQFADYKASFRVETYTYSVVDNHCVTSLMIMIILINIEKSVSSYYGCYIAFT